MTRSLVASLAHSLGFDSLDDSCRCEPSFHDPADAAATSESELHVDSTACVGRGTLAASADCRATVVEALTRRDVRLVRTRADGVERVYTDGAAALLVAAGRFVDRVAVHDARLAARATHDPLGAAHEATGRAGPVARIASETGLALGAERASTYDAALSSFVAPTVARCLVASEPPDDAVLVDGWDLDSGARVRLYDTPAGRRYQLVPLWSTLDSGVLETLAAGRRRLAMGSVEGGDRAAGRAIRRVADADDPVETLTTLLRKHTVGLGVLDDLLSDTRVTDVFVTGPVTANPVRVTVDGERLPTNVRLSPDGAAALASRFRRASGRAFSRSSPTLDATVQANGRRVRVAGVAPPASDGIGFAFRTHDHDVWTLARLVARGTLSAEAAALLSLAVRRGVAVLVAGPRGAGKTTMLGALLWELPSTIRTVVVEDTAELPVAQLRDAGRDVQPLRTNTDGGPELSPSAALRTALRLGDGALVVGEVRGEEAVTLYEAMRVGAADGAVLGTVHGTGGRAVYERVVSDLGVPPTAFSATDLVVTLTNEGYRHVDRVEEVRITDDGVHFSSLFEHTGSDAEPAALAPSGAVDRGDSALVARLCGPDESYTDVLAQLSDRTTTLARRAESGLTHPADRRVTE